MVIKLILFSIFILFLLNFNILFYAKALADFNTIPELIAEDNEPIGQRVPLILVHGRSGEDNPDGKQGWNDFINYLNTNLQPIFKIYRFKYPSPLNMAL